MTHVSFFTVYFLRKVELRTIFSLCIPNEREAVASRGVTVLKWISAKWGIRSHTGLPNLWHACPKWYAERFPWHAAITALPFFYFFCPISVSILWRICVYTHFWLRIEIVYEVPLVPNNTASETFLHKSRAMRSVDCIFVIGAPACRWLGECVTLDKTFYSLLFKQELVAATVTSTFSSLSHSSRRSMLEI